MKIETPFSASYLFSTSWPLLCSDTTQQIVVLLALTRALLAPTGALLAQKGALSAHTGALSAPTGALYVWVCYYSSASFSIFTQSIDSFYIFSMTP